MDKQKTFNKKLAEQARKKRAMFYKIHIDKNISIADLARKYKYTYERMRQFIRKAEEDVSH